MDCNGMSNGTSTESTMSETRELAVLRSKARSVTDHEASEGELMYGSSLSLTSALDGGVWLIPRPGDFTPGKDMGPTYRKLGRTKARCGRVQKILSSTGFDPRTVHPAASHCLAAEIGTCLMELYFSKPGATWTVILLKTNHSINK